MTLRLMLVDDHASILDILQTLLRGADDVTVVAQCEPGGGEWRNANVADSGTSRFFTGAPCISRFR